MAPVALTEKVAVCPACTVRLEGCAVIEGEPVPMGVEELLLHAVQFNNSSMDRSRPAKARMDMCIPLDGRRMITTIMPTLRRFY
jgi:hypothetical protein